MNRIVFDIEANGLLYESTRVWCIVAYSIDKDKWYESKDFEEVRWIFSDESNYLIGHNIIGYDLPLLRKLYGLERDTNIVDTYVVSRLCNPDRGFHSLGDWGDRFGISKVKQEQWTKWDDNMLIRCREDVRINTELYKELSRDCGDLVRFLYETA